MDTEVETRISQVFASPFIRLAGIFSHKGGEGWIFAGLD